jgi:hypothetical protein
MFDHCRLKDYTPGAGIALGAFAEQFDTDDWIDVTVWEERHQVQVPANSSRIA